jgi:hypothetical protein
VAPVNELLTFASSQTRVADYSDTILIFNNNKALLPIQRC